MASAAEAEQVPDVAAENLRTSGEIDDEAEPESLGALSSEQPESSEPFKDPVDLEECSLALSQFLRMDTVAQTAELDEQIEDMLRHIQEFCGHLGTIQSDTGFALQQKIPEIHSQAMHMKDMYEQVDQLEAFVAMVSKNVADMEECVANAEKLFGSNALTRALKGFSKPSFLSGFGSKPKVVASRPEARFEPPKIFSTDGYFPVSPTQSSTAVAAAAMEDDAS